MRHSIEEFYEFVQKPVRLRTRLLLALLAIPLVLSFTAPLWNISMIAPQYPKGLELEIYAHKVEGGRDGAESAVVGQWREARHAAGEREPAARANDHGCDE